MSRLPFVLIKSKGKYSELLDLVLPRDYSKIYPDDDPKFILTRDENVIGEIQSTINLILFRSQDWLDRIDFFEDWVWDNTSQDAGTLFVVIDDLSRPDRENTSELMERWIKIKADRDRYLTSCRLKNVEVRKIPLDDITELPNLMDLRDQFINPILGNIKHDWCYLKDVEWYIYPFMNKLKK